MIDDMDFSDAKKVRKTLLVASFTSICFKALIKHSTENIEFFGFKIPVEDASVIPNLLGYLIIYMMVSLIIRYSDEDLRKKYKSHVEYLELENHGKRENYQEARTRWYPSNFKILSIRYGIIFLDIIFPLLFALFTLFKIFIK